VGAAGREDLLLGAKPRRPLVGKREVSAADGFEQALDLVRSDGMAEPDLFALTERHENFHVATNEHDLEVFVRLTENLSLGALLDDARTLRRVDDVVSHLESHTAD